MSATSVVVATRMTRRRGARLIWALMSALSADPFEHSPFAFPASMMVACFLHIGHNAIARVCKMLPLLGTERPQSVAVVPNVSHWGPLERLRASLVGRPVGSRAGITSRTTARVRTSLNGGGTVSPHSNSRLESLVCVSDCALPTKSCSCWRLSLLGRAGRFF